MEAELSADDPRIQMLWLLLQQPTLDETPLSACRECGLLGYTLMDITRALSVCDAIMRDGIFNRGSGPDDAPGGLLSLLK